MYLGSCKGNFTVQTSPANRIVFARKGAKVNLQWNFICDGRLDTFTLWCGNDSKIPIGKDKYYNLSRINFDKENTVTRQVTMAISNFQRSENITCKMLYENNPSATFMLVEDGKHYNRIYRKVLSIFGTSVGYQSCVVLQFFFNLTSKYFVLPDAYEWRKCGWYTLNF